MIVYKKVDLQWGSIINYFRKRYIRGVLKASIFHLMSQLKQEEWIYYRDLYVVLLVIFKESLCPVLWVLMYFFIIMYLKSFPLVTEFKKVN